MASSPQPGAPRTHLPPSRAPRQLSLAEPALRLNPALAMGVFRHKLAEPFLLWAFLRYMNYGDNGRLRLDWAWRRALAIGLFTPHQLRRYLKKGEGVFWNIEQRGDYEDLVLVGAGRVAMALGVAMLSHRVVLLPLEDLRGLGVAKRRAMLWAVIFKPRGTWANPISQLTLQDLTRVGPRQQLRYRSDLVKVHRSLAIDEFQDHHGDIKRSFSELRVPLAYHTRLQVDGYGMARRVNKKLKAMGLVTGEAHHRYFKSAKAILGHQGRLWGDPWGTDLRLLVPKAEKLGSRPQWAVVNLSEARR